LLWIVLVGLGFAILQQLMVFRSISAGIGVYAISLSTAADSGRS